MVVTWALIAASGDGALIGYWMTIVGATLTLTPDDRSAHAQASVQEPGSNEQVRTLMELEAAEHKVNEKFSRTVPPGTFLYAAKDNGYTASRAGVPSRTTRKAKHFSGPPSTGFNGRQSRGTSRQVRNLDTNTGNSPATTP